MSTFPLLKTGVAVQYPVSQEIRSSTCVLRFLDGSEQRFRESPRALMRWEISLSQLDETETRRLEDFFQTQQGRCGEFEFIDPWTGQVYPSCSLEEDTAVTTGVDFASNRAKIVIRENKI
jgi:hypothetical protein